MPGTCTTVLAEGIVMKSFALLTNIQMDEDLQITRRIADYIRNAGGSCWVPPVGSDGYNDLATIPEGIECAITLGGDGTFLQAARRLRSAGIPLFGINIGNLGYLTSADLGDVPACLDELLTDQCREDVRMMLKGKVVHVSGSALTDTALNDIVISRAGDLRVVEFRIFIDEEMLNTYDADGIIVSTATGSTGYNLSAGGPVIMPHTNVMVITPICPHTLNSRSVILPAGARIRIEVGKRHKTRPEEAVVTFDGTTSAKMSIIDSVEIGVADQVTRILQRPGSGCFGIFH